MDGVREVDGVLATEGFADLGEAGVLFQVQCRTVGGYFLAKTVIRSGLCC